MTVRALIADDSEVFRGALRQVLEETGEISVVAETSEGHATVRQVLAQQPDVLALDLQMPHGDGLWVIEEVMARRPTPILVLTGRHDSDSLAQEAVRRGALQLVEKAPLLDAPGDRQALRDRVCLLAKVPVVRHGRTARQERQRPAGHGHQATYPAPQLVAIGASAGGPFSLAQLLKSIPPDLPACLALVQHVSPGFGHSFVEYLRTVSPLEVIEVQGRTPARPGTLLVASDHRHLVAVDGHAFDVLAGAPARGHCPSIDVLLASVARRWGDQALGVVLTGMGDDGARGLLQMRQAGAITVAQDQESSIVYGMPRAAAELGAPRHVLPLSRIGAFIVDAVRGATPPVVEW